VPQFRAGVLVLLALSFLVGVMPCAQGQQYKFQRLNPPGSTYSVAFGVNNNGVVVGSFVNASSEFEGFAYKSGKYEAIVFPGAVGFTQASGINDSNTVVGDFTGSDHFTHGFLVTPDGHFTQYDAAKGASTYIYGVNNAGDFAGFVGNDGANQGFVNVNGAVTRFTVNGNSTSAVGIDSSNNTVGEFLDASGLIHGFYRDAGGVITQIDYPGALTTSCSGINDLGVITGFYVDSANTSHGFAEKNGRFRTVPLPGIAGINNGESFVGSYIGQNQKNYGYVATRLSRTPAR